MECFTLKNLSFRYPSAAQEALHEISFSVQSGEFVTICGLSGCGKSTLLRQFKTCLQPFGECSGEIDYQGKSLSETEQRIQAAEIGFVQQSPEWQTITDKVWHELAFGLESLGFSRCLMQQRAAETASFFGIESWYERPVSTLSGGQKQLLHLASVMVMHPKVLILDEPTAQLDPIAACELTGWLQKIHTELGTTIILSEHHLDEVFSLSDRVIVMSEGRILSDTVPQQTSAVLYQQKHPAFLSLPSPTRISEMVQPSLENPPLCAAQGRKWLEEYLKSHTPEQLPVPERMPEKQEKPCLSLDNIWFRYEKNTPDILKGCSLAVHKGEFLTILGGNGTGKTTLLSLLAGWQKPYRGNIRWEGKKFAVRSPLSDGIALLPQNPQTLFIRSTVRDDLYDFFADMKIPQEEQDKRIQAAVELCGLHSLLMQHPYDLSGGEQQKAALAKVLLARPKILLLDEPTKGLDCAYQYRLMKIIRQLTDGGTTVIAVSHDIEFCAACADRCAMLFNGRIVSEGTPKEFFAANSLYTTAVCRMTKGLLPEAVTADDVLSALDTDNREPDFTDHFAPPPAADSLVPVPEILTGRTHKAISCRSVVKGILSVSALGVFVVSLLSSAKMLSLPFLSEHIAASFALLIVSAVAWLMLSRKGSRPIPVAKNPFHLKRSLIGAADVFLLIPVTIGLGLWLLDDTKYLFLSLVVLLESTIPFFLLFEKRKVQTRELVLTAVLCALCAAGRAAFYMLPAFKPVTALVIIAAIALGSESGFLIGSVSMLVSNFFFGQGLWTPWQMMSMGLIGYLAGVLFHRGILPANRASAAVFGFIAAIVIYGGLMNPAALLLSRTPFSWQNLLSVYAVGLPSDTVHAVATALFLYYAAEPMLAKLERIKKKYGLIR